MNPRLTAATTRRVLTQLRRDPRTVALMLVVPCVLMILLRYVFTGSSVIFDRIGPELLGIFPFTTMFVVTSVSTLRERTTGTLERLLTLPIAKLDVICGYALAFGLAGLVQVGLASTVALGLLGMSVEGGVPVVVLFAVCNALLGTGLGLFLSAFARTEFQAVQFLPATVLPQILLGGLLTPRDRMSPVLHGLSDVLPLSYAIDAMNRVTTSTGWSSGMTTDLAVVLGSFLAAVGLGAATLRRRTP
ncbi:MAG TPA: ABC transporter permease [Mycobacteriales bacterium]|nr:ABC transporter permease [Mycobacteriales bacterium]